MSSPPRPRNASTTRAAILASARKAFAASGYEGAGVRDIAKGAGVTAMLVNRYFGSKEQLFAEVVAASMAQPIILAPENLTASSRSEAMAAALVAITAADATPLEGFHIMLRSASSARAAEIARVQIEAHHQKTMAGAVLGAMPVERAALMLSLVAGIQVMRQMIGLKALTTAEPEALIRLLTPVVALLIEDSGPADHADLK
jgi:AcrR family transcriptional regulator